MGKRKEPSLVKTLPKQNCNCSQSVLGKRIRKLILPVAQTSLMHYWIVFKYLVMRAIAELT